MSLLELDRRALTLARTRLHTPRAERGIGTFSRAGEHAAMWFIFGAAGAVADRRQREPWLAGMRAVAGAYALNYAVKVAVRRRRPVLHGLPPLTPTVSNMSFPSAHATTSFAAAGMFRAVAPAAPLYATAVALAASRPYLGVHYPSDVVAGAMLGTALAVAWPRVDAALWPRAVALGGRAKEAVRSAGRPGSEVRFPSEVPPSCEVRPPSEVRP